MMMKKIWIVVLAVVLVLGCSEKPSFRNFVVEENNTPVYFEMTEKIPEHNISLGIEYPLLFENTVWNHMPIKFYIDTETSQNISWFSENVVEQTRAGINEWENATKGLISFEEVHSPDNADISIFWNKNFGAEGGNVKIGEALPEKVVWTGYYSLMLGGKITQTPYVTSCVNRIIATHEIGHMLGLDHNNNGKSIMYPYAWCYQTITSDIVEALEKLYSVSPEENHDIYIENATAVKHGKYLDAEMFLGNKGAANTPASKLSVIVNSKVVYEFDVKPIDGGASGSINFQNVLVEEEYDSVTLELNKDREIKELFYDNNIVILS